MNRRQFLHANAALATMLTSGALRPAAARTPDAGYAAKMARFDEHHLADVWLEPPERAVLKRTVARLGRVQRTIGFGNFGVVSFDETLKVARSYASVEAFRADELALMEALFFREASVYGFHGRKVVGRLTDNPRRRRMRAVRGTGHRLFRGDAEALYARLRRRVGRDLVLTSGVRGVVKQFHLFLRKAERADGNLSLASRSLAPPGYSFHGVGDFDVGQRGLGAANFTAEFARTRVYRRLVELGHIQLRYPAGNLLGVRFEPWHMKVVS